MSDSTAMTHPRAVLYLRQSTYKEESISLELQEAAGREHAARMGYDVTAVEADPGISGRTWQRPAVRRAMSAIEDGRADVIVLWKWSRLSRARLDWAIAVDKVESAGGRIESATEPTDTTTSAGRLSRGILAEFAAFESERIGEEWQRAIRSRQARGLPGTGGPRFGYIRIEKDQYEPDPITGPVLAELYRRTAAGQSLMSLAEWMNREGITTTTGGVWSRSRIRPILDSGFGAGLITAGRGIEQRYLPGAHAAVIDDDIWQQYLSSREFAPQRPTQNAARYPLTGIIVCADCESGMSITSRTVGTETRQIYGCNRYQKYRTGRFVTTQRERVEAWVRERLVEFVDELPDAIAQAARRRQRRTPTTDATTIARKIERIEAKIAKAMDGWADGTLTDDEYKAGVERYRQEREQLLARRHTLRTTAATADRLAAVANTLITDWDRLTPTELRALLAVLIERVTVTPPAPGTSTKAGARYDLQWRFIG